MSTHLRSLVELRWLYLHIYYLWVSVILDCVSVCRAWKESMSQVLSLCAPPGTCRLEWFWQLSPGATSLTRSVICCFIQCSVLTDKLQFIILIYFLTNSFNSKFLKKIDRNDEWMIFKTDKPSYYITYCLGWQLILVMGHSVTDVLAVPSRDQWKKWSERCKHCALAVVRRSLNFLPRCRPPSRGCRAAII